MAHIPVRTCVICRQRFAKKDLLRHVLHSEVSGNMPKTCADTQEKAPQKKQLYVDERCVLPGRGYYVCVQASCRKKFAMYTGLQKKRRTRHG